MNILFLGAPGSGKSTIGQTLAADFGWEWISTGEILRQSQEDWVIERLKTEQLFDDDMIMGLVIPRVTSAQNAIFDGFPRTLRQAEILIEQGIKPDLMVEVEVPLSEIHQRLSLRGREQDTPDIIDQRYHMYQDTKNEIMACLAGNGVPAVAIDGVGSPEEVYARAREAILKHKKAK